MFETEVVDGQLDGQQEVVESADPNVGQDTPVDDSASQFIPKQRFDQVYAKLKQLEAQAKAYGQLGDLKEIQRRLAEHERWSGQLSEYRKQQEQQSQQARIRKQLEDVYPELKQLTRIEELDRRTAAANAARASAQVSDLLKAQQIEISSELQEDVEDFLFSKMTEEQRDAMYGGDVNVVQDVFQANLNRGLLGALKARALATPPKPPARTQGGQTPPRAPDGKFTSKEDYHNAAWNAWDKNTPGT